MDETWLRPLVWMDYRLAVLFTVIVPVILLIWALVRQADAILRLLIIYWRVSSLLMITVYLAIATWSCPFSYITGLVARILIPISLWFWVDLNDEIRDLPQSFLKLVLTSWRWAVTIYSSLGAIASLPFLSCAFSGGEYAVNTPFCRVWLEAPWGYKEWFHPNASPGFLGFLGMVGLIIYTLYFAYFLLIRLGKQGRSALEQ
ncbi:hypothetical protein NIES593_19430 [Hydrococcus rivularis NIES-593]|uniref:DUF3177 domain-containing protein n=1 Tax=Hydrococcus rivularis NIES-593 TaxID=1921803 RepID=A0A1U7H9M8_9CYAN|nr:DUF3177 family protein [Hydrococcus rivularis]OKH20283.1 hypothetical protein NIES593_19430 [Hydrococcus rivularis NIES-593]